MYFKEILIFLKPWETRKLKSENTNIIFYSKNSSPDTLLIMIPTDLYLKFDENDSLKNYVVGDFLKQFISYVGATPQENYITAQKSFVPAVKNLKEIFDKISVTEYSDENGFIKIKLKSNTWLIRDYVISSSFNLLTSSAQNVFCIQIELALQGINQFNLIN